jgi:hypothetical protein
MQTQHIPTTPSTGGILWRKMAAREIRFATEECCALVDGAFPMRINTSPGIAIAASPNCSFARAGRRVASDKSSPFVVKTSRLEEVVSIFKPNGPALQARPIRAPSAVVLSTDPAGGKRACESFYKIMCQRLERLGMRANHVLACPEEEALAQSLLGLLRVGPAFVLITSTTASSGTGNAVGCATLRTGCRMECFLAPVDPGSHRCWLTRTISLFVGSGMFLLDEIERLGKAMQGAGSSSRTTPRQSQ